MRISDWSSDVCSSDLFVSANAAAASNPGTPTTPPDPRTLGPRETASSALPSYIEEIERAAIQQALQENRYNKTKAAAALGITFRALRYKLKKDRKSTRLNSSH